MPQQGQGQEQEEEQGQEEEEQQMRSCRLRHRHTQGRPFRTALQVCDVCCGSLEKSSHPTYNQVVC